jgi:hypothetical protein
MAAPVYRMRTPTGTGAEMLQFKSANGSRESRRWAKAGKTKTFPRGRNLKVYREFSVGLCEAVIRAFGGHSEPDYLEVDQVAAVKPVWKNVHGRRAAM